MIKLRPLPTCSHYEFDRIHESKKNPTHSDLTGIRSEIRERYNEYYNHFNANSLEKILDSEFIGSGKDALKHCYEIPVHALENLKVRIKQNQAIDIKGICQFCGLDSDNTFDHFLPKEMFPDFSVNHRNLMPCCYTCNQLKNTYWLDASSNKKGVINLYSDDLPIAQFLFVHIEILHNLPIGKYYINNDAKEIDAEFYETIANHFRQLKLTSRYDDRFSNTFGKLINSIKPVIVAGFPARDIKALLENEMNSDICDFGLNHHMTILKKKLCDDENLLDKLIEIYK